MKRLSYLNLIVLLLLITACGGQKKGPSQSDMIKANQIIAYTNNVIIEANTIFKWAEQYERHFETLTEIALKPALSKSTDNIFFFSMGSPFGTFYYGMDPMNKRIDLTKVSNQLDETDLLYFTEASKNYHNDKNAFENLYKELKTYLDEENYKDDKGAKGKLYADSIGYYYSSILIQASEMSERAAELGEEAELLTLGESPMRDLIMLMREEMKTSKNAIRAFRAYEAEEVSKEEAIRVGEIYLTTYNENKEKRTSLKLNNVQESRFSYFTKTDDDLYAIVKRTIRSLKNNEEVKSSEYDNMENRYQALIDNYNYTIK